MATGSVYSHACFGFIVGLAVTSVTGAIWAQAAPDGTGSAGAPRREGNADAVLSLDAALDLAMRGHPGLAARACGVRAAEARVRHAGARPNPELALGVSEYDRNGNGFDSAEIEAAISQRFELGGKRRGRQRVAEAEHGLSERDLASLRLDVRAETTRRFVALVAAQARVALAGAALQTAERVAFAVEERVKAGKEPPMRAAKAQAELELARLHGTTERKALGAARSRLTAMWGDEICLFAMADDTSAEPLAPPEELETLHARLPTTPEWGRWEDELRLREALLAAEKAERVPDMEVSAGLQRFAEDSSDAVLFGIALPLPLFNRNQGRIEAARHERDRIREERRSAHTALQAELAVAYAAFDSSHERARTLREKIVPTMERAFEVAHEGYRQGKFSYLDMLDAQRAVLDARASLIDAIETRYTTRADIERLTGVNVSPSTAITK